MPDESHSRARFSTRNEGLGRSRTYTQVTETDPERPLGGSESRTTMTHIAHTPASTRRPVRRKTTLPSDGLSGRARRARVEPMAVRPLRDGRYVVETDGGTYVVDVEARTCTCPDNAIRHARCKHLRRVAIEITRGEVPPPGRRRATCAVCGDETFVPMDATGPQLCRDHDHRAGDLVRDRESGGLLVVTRALGTRADETPTETGTLVSAYETNADYGDHEPTFEAVYLDSLPVNAGLSDLGELHAYRFPASRLSRVERGFVGANSLGERLARA
ncbi:SWIM zinc finger containing protein [Haloferax volcanii]|nr:SWIM zinc finger containing protein [Haloferax lucentense]